MVKIIWENIPSELSLNDNEIHIYQAEINSAKGIIPMLEKFLSGEERNKVSNYIFEKDRTIQIISKGVLKEILSRYLNLKPEDIFFSYNKYGKPFIEEKINKSKISFNLSHSGEFILYVISYDREIGVDVQEIREIDSLDDIIKQNFSGSEIDMLKTLSKDEKRDAFFSCWTKKEAYVKALGLGLSYPLNKFSVSIFSGEDDGLIYDENNDISRWSLRKIPLASGYAAAVAVEGKNMEYRYYKWSC